MHLSLLSLDSRSNLHSCVQTVVDVVRRILLCGEFLASQNNQFSALLTPQCSTLPLSYRLVEVASN